VQIIISASTRSRVMFAHL